MNTPTATVDRGSDARDRLARRIRNEYLEMPGLALTLREAQRLWQMQAHDCEELLAMLVRAGFLVETRRGQFVRAGSGMA